MTTKPQATVEDLYRIPDRGKAEIVNGGVILMSPTGDMPGRAGGAIYASLRGVEREAGGRAYPDNVGFKVDLPKRKSFSPDAAFYTGAPSGMKFLDGAPSSPSKSEARTITGGRRRPRWRQSAAITSPPARSSFGTLIC